MNTVEIMNNYLNTHTNERDDGLHGDALEIAIRAYLSGRIPESISAQGKTDIRATLPNKKRVTCEIKSACGEVEAADKSQLILYCMDVDPDFPAELQTYVFTREEWRAFLTGYTGRGKFLREDTKRGHSHIQSFYVSETKRPKASKTIAAYIEATLYELPTVADVFERNW